MKINYIKPNKQLSKEISNYYSIGCETADFLSSKFNSLSHLKNALFNNSIHDPFLLNDMGKTVDRIMQARVKKETVLVYGDYDADGMISIVIISRLLEFLSIKNVYFQPSSESMYGFSKDGVEFAIKIRAQLIIAVDCGSTDSETIRKANIEKIDTIILDHHRLTAELPQPYALINQYRNDDNYPFKGLTAGGLALKLIQAMIIKYHIGKELLAEAYHLAAVSTIADIGELIDENRSIVAKGFKTKGSLALNILADNRDLSVERVGFEIAPLLNAARRFGRAGLGTELLISRNLNKINYLKKELINLNNARKRLQRNIFKRIYRRYSNELNNNDEIVMIKGYGWPKGIIGPISSELAYMYYRPAIVFSAYGDLIFGSGRSIPGISLIDLLYKAKKYFIRWGGHSMAAGIVMPLGYFSRVKRILNGIFAEMTEIESPEESINIVKTDINFRITEKLLKDIEEFEPYGKGFEKPVFEIKNCEVIAVYYLRDYLGIKLELKTSTQRVYGVAWHTLKFPQIKKGNKLDIYFTPQKNMGKIQLNIKHLVLK